MTNGFRFTSTTALLAYGLAMGASSSVSSCGEGGAQVATGSTVNGARTPAAGGRVLSTTDFGAAGDGRTPATAALQKAVDAAQPGDTIRFASGTYLIDTAVGLRLKDNMVLDLGDAVLTGPNVSGARCRVIFIEGGKNIVIRGGTLVGSRAGNPQWGIGILASDAEDLTIEDVRLHDFYFDGILLTGNNRCRRVTIRNVVSENNRRTGLAIVAASDVLVENGTFRGSKGQSPEAGLNVEPNAGDLVERVRINGSTFSGNAGIGLYIHKALGVSVTDVAVENSVAEGNDSGIVISGVEGARVTANRVSRHPGKAKGGIVLGGAKQVVVSDNQVEESTRGIFSAGGFAVDIRANTVIGRGPVPEGGDDSNGIVCLGLLGASESGCTIVGNTVRRASSSGIVVQSVTKVGVSDNVVEDAGQRGIFLRSASVTEVRSNTVSNSGLAAPGSTDGIELVANANDNVVVGNTIRRGRAMRLPIGVGPGCRGNQISDNVVIE